MENQEWLNVVRNDYLRDFIRHGGAAVKFAVPADAAERQRLVDGLRLAAQDDDFAFAFVDAATTKIHMIDHLFHEVARQVDWDGLAHAFVSRLVAENKYEIPKDPASLNLDRIAALNGREPAFLRNEIHGWLENAIYRDNNMSLEFRIAMIQLCKAQLDARSGSSSLYDPIKEWLRGELRLIGVLKKAVIFQKVARHNARHMLHSLAHWLKLAGRSGLVLTLDIARYTHAKKSGEPDDTLYHTAAAAMDAYEVLRQFIDGTDEVENCLIAVVAASEFLHEGPRALARYQALNLRLSDDVRDRKRQNPYASLIRLSPVATVADERLTE